jgi:hypothetical protein
MKIMRLGSRFFDLHDPQDCARITPGALKSYFQLAHDWEIPDREARTLLGRISDEEYARMRADPTAFVLEASKLKRIACLLSIHRELELLYGASIASEWVRLPNSHPMFCRVTPLMYMLIGGAQAMGNVQRLLIRRRRAATEAAAEPIGETATPPDAVEPSAGEAGRLAP